MGMRGAVGESSIKLQTLFFKSVGVTFFEGVHVSAYVDYM
jgi:hypothetical protein